jgi:hypothetical protein
VGPGQGAEGSAGGGHGLDRKLQSGDFPLPYLEDGIILPGGSGITRKKGFCEIHGEQGIFQSTR